MYAHACVPFNARSRRAGYVRRRCIIPCPVPRFLCLRCVHVRHRALPETCYVTCSRALDSLCVCVCCGSVERLCNTSVYGDSAPSLIYILDTNHDVPLRSVCDLLALLRPEHQRSPASTPDRTDRQTRTVRAGVVARASSGLVRLLEVTFELLRAQARRLWVSLIRRRKDKRGLCTFSPGLVCFSLCVRASFV